MVETTHMVANYPLGDVYPNGQRKVGDAANFGIFKQNWLMIRSSSPQFAGLGPTQYLSGAVLNVNLGLDIQVLHASQSHYGLYGTWFAGHRNGTTGLGNPNTADVLTYRDAVFCIRDQIDADPKCLTDDTKFWFSRHLLPHI